MSEKREKRAAVPTSIRVSETGKKLWEATAEHLGLSLAATFEQAIRKLAYNEGIKIDGVGEDKPEK